MASPQNRPSFHFTPESGWMNDPNGLIFYQGEYHLFYQHHPHSLTWGPMHWGHAVSTDLTHWTPLPIALAPDENGAIFSGSVVSDADNTSGLVPGGGLVAVFSFDTQAQGLAYSTDRGRTWTKYAGNPVIPSPGHDFRDPKVFWHAPTAAWVMAVAAGDRVDFYRSPNLIDWTQTGTFGAQDGAHGGVWECPDLFPLETNGRTVWVLLVSVGGGAVAGGSGTQYFIGGFDGSRFVSANPPAAVLWLDSGPDNYAGATFADAPGGQRILIGWLNDWRYARHVPAGGWRGAMTVPRVLRLRDLPGRGLRLTQKPVTQTDSQRTFVQSEQELLLNNSAACLPPVERPGLNVLAEFKQIDAAEFGLRVHGLRGEQTIIGIDAVRQTLFVDRRHSGRTSFHEAFPAVLTVPLLAFDTRLVLRVLLDVNSVEVFADGGATVLTAQIFPRSDACQLEVYARAGSALLARLDVHAL